MIRDQIRKAAQELFARISFVKTSIADIAKACGLGKAAIYQHFHSKDEIFAAVVVERLNRLITARAAFDMDNAIPITAKLTTLVGDLVEEFFAIRDLLFGGFETVDGAALRDVFGNYGAVRERIVDRTVAIAHSAHTAAQRPDLELVVDLIVGRMLLFLVNAEWNDKEGLKALVTPLAQRLYDTLIRQPVQPEGGIA